MHIGYRRDIDGLRFIAVSSVVLFHAGLETMSGGFVGVDIFFVISGYLITCGLFKDADGQGISIARFYERRIKRIIPAYAAVIVATMLAGLFVLLPSQLADLGKSALAATLFVANIHFWTGAGYFAGDPLSHPLLHLWSLAVEEQFYIVWPVFVLLLYRMGLARWRVPLILAGIAVTLVASQLMLGYSAKTAFYMAPLRAWELLVGALLACGHWPRLKAGWMAHAIGALALALILVPMFTYTEASQFPGCRRALSGRGPGDLSRRALSLVSGPRPLAAPARLHRHDLLFALYLALADPFAGVDRPWRPAFRPGPHPAGGRDDRRCHAVVALYRTALPDRGRRPRAGRTAPASAWRPAPLREPGAHWPLAAAFWPAWRC
jgi:hypothetical protein